MADALQENMRRFPCVSISTRVSHIYRSYTMGTIVCAILSRCERNVQYILGPQADSFRATTKTTSIKKIIPSRIAGYFKILKIFQLWVISIWRDMNPQSLCKVAIITCTTIFALNIEQWAQNHMLIFEQV